MQFLETIEGKSGEELTSAVLKFLLINSTTMRERFVQRLRHQLPASKVPTFRDGIICQCEVAVSNDESEGRIDLLVREEAGMVLGLENKFWADFTIDQPKKYWKGLWKFANQDESACRLILLFPRARHDEMCNHLAAQQLEGKCAILHWEDIQLDLREVAGRDRTEVVAAAIFLDEYVERQVLDINIEISPQQMVGRQVEIPNDFHYDFLYKLKSCLPNPERIRPAKTWIGFNFSVIAPSDSTDLPKQWFGFYRNIATNAVVMGIHTDIPSFPAPQHSWARVTAGFGNAAFVELVYDGSVKNTLEWKERLQALIKPLADAVTAQSTTNPSTILGSAE